jgi:hypothetical protein
MYRKFVSFAVFLLTMMWAVTVSAGSTDIYAFKMVAGQTTSQPADYFSVKLCRAGTQTCTFGGTTDSFGHGNVYISPSFPGQYDLYLYRNYGAQYGGEWGSQTQPIAGGSFYIPTGFTSITVWVPPRPLAPGLVSPCAYCGVPSGNFYLSWTSGLDSTRTAANWPVTYEIWTSSTPVGWPQGQEWLAVPDAPCNPDAQGRCRWYVDYIADEPGAQYTWRIVVKLNIGGGLIYKTSGQTWHIHQNY